MRRVARHGHREDFNLSIRIRFAEFFLKQHRKRLPLRIVILRLVGPNGRHAVTKRNRVAKTDDAKRAGRLWSNRIVRAKVLRIR